MPAADYTATIERALLASCLWDPRGMTRASVLSPDDFADFRHQTIFSVGQAVAPTGTEPDSIGILLELVRLGRLADAGGKDYVAGLAAERLADPARLPQFVAQVAELAARRRAVAGLAAAQRAFSDPARPLPATLDALRATITDVARSHGQDEFARLGEIADEVLDEFRHPADHPRLPTGIGPLDEALGGGLRPSQLVVVGGATGSGKTALATQTALGAAVAAAQHPERFGAVLYASYEMSRQELYARMAAQVADARDGYHPPRGWSARDLPRVEAAVRAIAPLPLLVRDDLAPTVEAVQGWVERYAAAHGGPGLLIVDHIHLLTAPRATNQLESLTHISRSLKALAMQLGVPVLALAQLNREPGHRDSHRPVLADLRASGSIEQDADIVVLVHRPSYYLEPQTRAELEQAGAPAEIELAKHRAGPTGMVTLTWLGPRTLYVVDPAWQPRYGPAPLDVRSIITPPSQPSGIEERLIAIVAEHVVASGQRATRATFFEAFGSAGRKWQDWPHGRVIDRLVAAARLCAAQVGSGRTAQYQYWLPDQDPATSPRLVDVTDSSRRPADDDGARDELFE